MSPPLLAVSRPPLAERSLYPAAAARRHAHRRGSGRSGVGWRAAPWALLRVMIRVMIRVMTVLAIAAGLPGCHRDPVGPGPLRLFAAASTVDAVAEVLRDYAGPGTSGSGGAPAVVVHAGSSGALARQIEAGAPADLFLSANARWMEHLVERGVVDPARRRPLLRNRLVMVVPAGLPAAAPGADPLRLPLTCLSLGEPASVPAGLYAKQFLERGGAWSHVAPRVVGAADVRAALARVERGECELGIVYATDARASDRVRVEAVVDAGMHEPIVYPLALLGDRPGAAALYAHLASPEAGLIFARHGFVPGAGEAGGAGGVDPGREAGQSTVQGTGQGTLQGRLQGRRAPT